MTEWVRLATKKLNSGKRKALQGGSGLTCFYRPTTYWKPSNSICTSRNSCRGGSWRPRTTSARGLSAVRAKATIAAARGVLANHREQLFGELDKVH